MTEEIIKYEDWRDDAIIFGVHLTLENSRFASPVCPYHGSLSIRKKKINIWKCNKCDFKYKVDEQYYRKWLRKMINIENENRWNTL